MNITPTRIQSLQPNEVFVFGANHEGKHNGGAARLALLEFGAVYGQAEGLQGQSYAIPTMEKPGGRVLNPEEIKPYVVRFIAFAEEYPELHFFVTEIVCGIAGRAPEEMAPLFAQARNAANISLPAKFWL